jgi:hypothetical protein
VTHRPPSQLRRRPDLPPSLSPAATDFLSAALSPAPADRPTAHALLRHAFVNLQALPPPPAPKAVPDDTDDSSRAGTLASLVGRSGSEGEEPGGSFSDRQSVASADEVESSGPTAQDGGPTAQDVSAGRGRALVARGWTAVREAMLGWEGRLEDAQAEAAFCRAWAEGGPGRWAGMFLPVRIRSVGLICGGQTCFTIRQQVTRYIMQC